MALRQRRRKEVTTRAIMISAQLLIAALLAAPSALAELVTMPGTAFSPSAQPASGSTGVSAVSFMMF